MSKNPELKKLCGAGFEPVKSLVPFSKEALSFLSDLSVLLINDKEAKAYPDVVTFAFFCRKAGIQQLKAEYEGALDDRLGRGSVFHIAPSNVPINFAYSLLAALLAGNQSVVKASSQDFAQVRIVCRAMDMLLTGKHKALASYVNVVIYPREAQSITEAFSAACDVRIIWGGDETVRRVREAKLLPQSFDVTFADRYSLLCVRAEAVLNMDAKQLEQMAKGFYNDTYLNDQNACTTPRLVYWVGLGEELNCARRIFWEAIHAYTSERYSIEPVIAVDKLTAACRAAIEMDGVRWESQPDNLVVRISVETLTSSVDEHRCAGGLFIEHTAESLDALLPIVKRKYQTLSYLGFEAEELRQFVRENGLCGIDRIVPIGHTMDFALTWDGYDLIGTLSRRIAI